MNGFYNLIKPIGFSSSDLVIKVRGILRSRLGKKVKIGHLGTLDPQATGVLGVAVGSATKLFDYFLKKRKVYIASCVLGKETDTLDSAGQVIKETDRLVSEDEFRSVLPRFVGEIDQLPPAYSAKSINGIKAYRLARKGIDAPLSPCKVTIYDLEYLGMKEANSFQIRITCSGGTYIRSLCRDIGAALDCPAYMGALTRIQNGVMKIEDAVEWQDVERDIRAGFTSLEDYANSIRCVDFPEELRKSIENGVKRNVDLEDGLVCVRIGDVFYAIGDVRSNALSIIARNV